MIHVEKLTGLAVTPSFRGPGLLGGATIIALVLSTATWSLLAPIASAVITSGTIVVETNRKAVQHVDGGIVKLIKIREGELVSKGQSLITVDGSRQESTRHALLTQVLANSVQLARLQAERAGNEELVCPKFIPDIATHDLEDACSQQTRLFASRREALKSRISSLISDGAQAEVTIPAVTAQVQAQTAKVSLTQLELRNASTLATTGYGTKQRVLEIGRALADAQSNLSASIARLAEIEQRVTHAGLEVNRVERSFAESVELDIQAQLREMAELRDKLNNVTEQLRRSDILAPDSGRIVGLVVHTVGAVIAPGAVLMEIVPQSDQLLIEAQLKPADAEAIEVGAPVDVRIPSYEGKRMSRMLARVDYIAADRQFDRARGFPFFTVRVRLENVEGQKLPKQLGITGMNVDLFIFKGERTPFDYLIDPLVSFFTKSFRE